MTSLELFAHPWWVNSAVLIPFALFWYWRRNGGLGLANKTLVWAAVFAIAFAFIEAAVVVYLRAALGLLPGYEGTLTDVRRLAADYWRVAEIPSQMPVSLAAMEVLREIGTMIILIAVAMLAAQSWRERVAAFFWIAAIWDVFYYVWLWSTVGWPISFLSPDVLFLIQVPWYAQVWFPVLVSALTAAAVVFSRRRSTVV